MSDQATRRTRRRTPIAERFWPKVDKSGECWVWTGSRDRSGYGKIARFCPDGNVRPALAHRIAYELEIGPIPEGLTLDHLCRNSSCVRPSHLEPVTMRENILRGTGPSARHAKVTHCPQGHEYAAGNIVGRTDRRNRDCLTCARLRAQARRDARRAA